MGGGEGTRLCLSLDNCFTSSLGSAPCSAKGVAHAVAIVPEWIACSGSSDQPPTLHRGSIGFEVCGTSVVVVVVLWSKSQQLLFAHDLSVPSFRGTMTVWGCLASFLHVPTQLPHARTSSLLFLSGLGLGSVVRARHAAHCASWVDDASPI